VYRAETLERRAIINGQACPRFEPPPAPPGAGKVWEPEALKARASYLAERADLSRAFTAQGTAREWSVIERRLRRAKSALDALAILQEMESFLTTDPLITRIDVAASLEVLNTVKLPFERLVRNVWVEGPEVQYDRAKLHVLALLQAEIDTRERQVAEDSERVPLGPRREVAQLVSALGLQWQARQAVREAVREAVKPKFKGARQFEREKPTAVQASQRTLLASFR
jgi:hypothetical protein